MRPRIPPTTVYPIPSKTCWGRCKFNNHDPTVGTLCRWCGEAAKPSDLSESTFPYVVDLDLDLRHLRQKRCAASGAPASVATPAGWTSRSARAPTASYRRLDGTRERGRVRK